MYYVGSLTAYELNRFFLVIFFRCAFDRRYRIPSHSTLTLVHARIGLESERNSPVNHSTDYSCSGRCLVDLIALLLKSKFNELKLSLEFENSRQNPKGKVRSSRKSNARQFGRRRR